MLPNSFPSTLCNMLKLQTCAVQLFSNKISHSKIYQLNILKHKLKQIEKNHFYIYNTSQTASSRLIRTFPEYLLFLSWLVFSKFLRETLQV